MLYCKKWHQKMSKLNQQIIILDSEKSSVRSMNYSGTAEVFSLFSEEYATGRLKFYFFNVCQKKCMFVHSLAFIKYVIFESVKKC
jgi:hypothetical protein